VVLETLTPAERVAFVLLAMLDPAVVPRADRTAVESGAMAEVLGAAAVAETFSGRARVARLALVAAIDLLADPETLGALDLEIP
jgi:hypothetical protein